MDDLREPLTEQEVSILDDFLLDRLKSDEETPDLDEGILNVSEFDGFLTAIVSGPRVVPPSEWLPLVWGDDEPVWDSEGDFRNVFGLMVRHMNGIAGELMAVPEEFEPVFLEQTVEGVTYTIVDEWCAGYLRGVHPCFEIWADAAPESYDLLAPIFVFGHERGWKFIEEMDVSAEERLEGQVAPAARAIHAFWLARRTTTDRTVRAPRRARGVGRNQSCPCGSGRKYKHCCLR